MQTALSKVASVLVCRDELCLKRLPDLRLIGYGYRVAASCVFACGNIIALSPFHCWYVLICVV